MEISLIDVLTSLAGLGCVFLAGRASKYNFWLGYVYTALLFVMFWKGNVYSALMLQPISLGINILGHYRWTHPREHLGEQSASRQGELKVRSLGWTARIVWVVAIPLVSFAWGWFLNSLGDKITPDPVPYLDALVTVLILSAQYLSAQKKLECWVVWILVNIFQLILHIKIGNVFMPVVCGLYLINAVVSFVKWIKFHRNGE